MSVRVHLLTLASLLVLAACAPQQAADTEADVAAVRAHVNQFVATWNVADHAALSSMVAEDAILMQPDESPLEGRDAILATMADGYDIAMMQQSATVDEVIVMGDNAYARGTWRLSPTSAADPNAPALQGKWSTLYRRGNGNDWQVWRWMWNQPSDQAPAGG
ncbi:MAG: nuclear transport factor 2 family protein [Gemmatimonadota bacterium]|nr:nuclear transport factor 2 family protein [Gemmatimonadota bacterium]